GGDGGTDRGFPPTTPWTDMEPAEQVAYWRHQSRKHERTAESRRDYDALKADSAELTKLREKNQTAEEKALEDARRQGENLGAEKYLKDAVEGHLRGETGKTAEEVAAALKFVDVSAFVGSDGRLDPALISEFAQSLGKSTAGDEGQQQQQQQRGGGIRQELNRGGGAKQQRTSGSLAERKKARLAELTKSTTQS